MLTLHVRMAKNINMQLDHVNPAQMNVLHALIILYFKAKKPYAVLVAPIISTKTPTVGKCARIMKSQNFYRTVLKSAILARIAIVNFVVLFKDISLHLKYVLTARQISILLMDNAIQTL